MTKSRFVFSSTELNDKVKSLPFSNAELNNKVKSLPFSNTELNDKVKSLPFSNAELNNKVKSLPFSSTELNNKVRSLLVRAQNIFKNSSVIPSHLGAHPLFICSNAHRNPFSTTTPSHLSVCVTEILEGC